MKKWRYTFATIGIIAILGVLLFFEMRSAGNQGSYVIGVLMAGEHRLEKLDGLKDGLRDLGYEDEQLTFHTLDGIDRSSALTTIRRQLIASEPDVIVALGAVETLALKQELEQTGDDIPVVFAGVAEPIQLGFIEDYTSPGGMFTGVHNHHVDLSAKRLELIVDLLPNLQRVIVLYSGQIEASRLSYHLIETVAPSYGVTLVAIDMDEKEAAERWATQLQPQDAILVLPSYRMEVLAENIASTANEHGVPTMGIYTADIEAGFLFAYGAPFYDQGYQAARHVSAILKGNRPEDIPVELPDTIRFSVNVEVQKQLDVEIHADVLHMADRVSVVEAKQGGTP